jgi:hypothetical protein
MKRGRRISAALALLSVAFYTLLLPWHLTSQFRIGLFEAEFGPIANVICVSAAKAEIPAVPGAPSSNCPICKGLAAFQVAFAGATPALTLPASFSSNLFDVISDDVVGTALPIARSRGPPRLA